jgi:hypothetical protein
VIDVELYDIVEHEDLGEVEIIDMETTVVGVVDGEAQTDVLLTLSKPALGGVYKAHASQFLPAVTEVASEGGVGDYWEVNDG